MTKKLIEVDSLCFWCGHERGKDKVPFEGEGQAPKRAVVSYEPCGSCKEKFDQGVAIFETKKAPYYEKQPPLFEEEGVEQKTHIFPSGRWVVLPTNLVSAVFKDADAAEFKKVGHAFLDEESFRLVQGKGGEHPTQH